MNNSVNGNSPLTIATMIFYESVCSAVRKSIRYSHHLINARNRIHLRVGKQLI